MKNVQLLTSELPDTNRRAEDDNLFFAGDSHRVDAAMGHHKDSLARIRSQGFTKPLGSNMILIRSMHRSDII